MKKLLCLLLTCSVLTTMALPLSAVAVEGSINEVVWDVWDEVEPSSIVWKQLKQFVEEQKESGNTAFDSVSLYNDSIEYFVGEMINGVREIPEEYQDPKYLDKVVVEYSRDDEEIVTASIEAFIQENDIDGSFVFYVVLDDVPKAVGTPVANPGDVNGDNGIDILDVVSINKAVLGIETLTAEQNQSADVDGNGIVDSVDSLLVMKYIVGIIDSFDVQ